MSSNPSEIITVTVVEDDPGLRADVEALLGNTEGFVCHGAHKSSEAALQRLNIERPRVLIADLNLPGMSGIELIGRVKKCRPNTEIIVLTIHDDPPRLFAALEAGASGYLTKPITPGRLLESIQSVARGESPMSGSIARLVIQSFQERARAKKRFADLTERETQVLEIISTGASNKEVAAELDLSLSTVSTHIRNTYEKLQVNSRTEAAALFLRKTDR